MKHPLPRISRIRSTLALTAAVLLTSSWVPMASARLFLAPETGDVIMDTSSSQTDDGLLADYFPIFSPYFGANPAYSASISVNGNILFGPGDGFGEYFTRPLGSDAAIGINRVAPLWLDLRLSATGSIRHHIVDFSYYAVTWQNMELGSGVGGTGSFQAIFFETDTTLGGSSFLAGDIVFSYANLNFYPNMGEFIIGLQSADGSYAVAPNGDGTDHLEGWYSPAEFGSFPYADDEFLLFRADGTNYVSSIGTMEAIPEPSTLAALISGALLMGWRGYRCRRA